MINRTYYAFWKDRFDNLVKQHGESIYSVDYHDKVTHDKFKFFILTMLDHISAKKILDLGGGIGLISSQLAQQNLVYNLDISEEQLKQSNKYNIFPVQGNAIILPFKDRSFDYVICCGLIQFIPVEDRMKLLNEIFRVCKPNGLVFIESPNYDALIRRLMRLFNRMKSKIYEEYTYKERCFANYLSLPEFIDFFQKSDEQEVNSIFLIYRPLQDLVTLTKKIDTAKSIAARWLCTDFTFVFKRNCLYLSEISLPNTIHLALHRIELEFIRSEIFHLLLH